MTTTDWDASQHPRGEGARFVEKQQSVSTAAFPNVSGFLRHDETDGTFAFPPKRFTDVDEAVDYWSRVEVPEDVLFSLQYEQREHRKRVGGDALNAARERVRAKAMEDAVRSHPEPRRKDIHTLDINDLKSRNLPDWFNSDSKQVQQAREQMVEQAMANAEDDIEAEWSRDPRLPKEISAADARTVARVVRMTELFEGDRATLRDVPVEWRGEAVTIRELERELGGFTQFRSCRRAKSKTEAAAREGHTRVDW